MEEILDKSISCKTKEISIPSLKITFASIFQFKKKLYLISLISVIIDVLLVTIAFYLAFNTYFNFGIPEKNILLYKKYFLFYIIFKILVLFILGLYNESAYEIKSQTIFSLTEALIVSSVLEFFIASSIILYSNSKIYEVSRFVILLKSSIELILIGLWRLLCIHIITAKNILLQKTLIIGLTDEARDLIQENESKKGSFRKIIGYLDLNQNQIYNNTPYLGGPFDVASVIDKYMINEVIIMSDVSLRNEILKMINNRTISVKVFPKNYEMVIGKFYIDEIGGIPLFEINKAHITLSYIILKRLIDIFISAIGLILFSPIFIALSIIYRIFYGGSVIYKQPRIGRGNKIFMLYKIRTMIKNAEKITGPVMSHGKDTRVLKIGWFLRKTHLDEVLQLFNVLLGHMSLVGPRPERPELAEKFNEKNPLYSIRHSVKPGLTGIGQVKGKYTSNFEYKLSYDLLYVYNMSFLLDLKILFYTPKYIFSEIFGEKNIY